MRGAGFGPPLFLFMRLAIFALAFTVYAQDCETRLTAAREFFTRKDFKPAAREFEGALTVCPQRTLILLDLAKAHFMAQDFELADQRLAELIKAEPRNPAALKLRGDAAYFLGRDKEAEALLAAAAAADPKNPEPPYALGRILYQQGRFEEAIANYRKSLQLDSNSYRAYDNLGLAYEGLNDPGQAMQNYKKALELVHQRHPDYDWVYGNLSNFLYKLGDYKQAFQFGAEAANRNPNSARNFFLTGKALVKLERWELAAKWLSQSVQLDGDYPEARYQYAQVLRKLNRKEEADQQLAAFKEINARQPRNKR